MPRYESDNPAILKELKKLEKLVLSAGGWMHQDLIIRVEDGSLSIEMEGDEEIDKEKLILLPQEALIPTDEINMGVKNATKEFVFEPKDPKKYTKLRRELTETMFTIYNMTNKYALCEQTDFWLTIGKRPELLDLVMAARTPGQAFQKIRKNIQAGLSEEKHDQFVADRFFGSRILGLGGGKSATGKGQNPKMPVIMPFIDFINHHSFGSRFLSPANETLEVWCRRPVEGSNECYAFYGTMDAMDAYIRYGFVDAQASIVRSVPLRIDLPNVGRIEVKAGTPAHIKKLQLPKKAKDLQAFVPVMQKDQDVLTISHLYVPVGHSPRALARVLGLCISKLAGRNLGDQKHKALVAGAERQVHEANVNFYTNLRTQLEDIKAKTKDKDQTLEDALHLARTQEQKVKSYNTVFRTGTSGENILVPPLKNQA